MRRRLLALLILTAIVLLPQISAAQATVDESQETAFLYVDGTVGSDSNPGTAEQPLRTISAAVDIALSNNHSGIGTRITINPGTYRESISLSANSRDTSLPITFQAATAGTVIVSGGVLYDGWTQYASNPNIYTHVWTNNWGLCAQISGCPTAGDIVQRQEMIAVNGKALTQVSSVAAMQPGSFYVDNAGVTAYVWPPSGTNMASASVDVATLPDLFHIYAKTNIVVRGIVFQYANSCRGDAAVSVSGQSSNILFDSDMFQWNNAQGLSLSNPGTNFTVMNSVSNHNGDSGFQVYKTRLALWQNDVASYNNWRGAQAGYYGCNVGGGHFYGVHDDTVNGFSFLFNQSYGLHWDTDDADVTTTGINSSYNLLPGLFSENNQGPITIDHAYMCNQTTAPSSGGLAVRNSQQTILTNSVLSNNAVSQVNFYGEPGGFTFTDWETGNTVSVADKYFTNHNNIFLATGTQNVFQDNMIGDDWTGFQTTLDSNYNTWWTSGTLTAPFMIPVPRKGSATTFSGWQSTTGQDLNSLYQPASGNPTAACTLTPDYPDYWVTVNNTQLAADTAGRAIFTFTVVPQNFTGTINLTIDGVAGVPGLSYILTPGSINTSGTATLTLTAAAGTPAGSYPITLIANNGNLTHSVTVLFQVKESALLFSPGMLTFPNQQVNIPSSPLSFTVTNLSDDAVTFTSITSTSTNFAQSNDCGTELAGLQSCTVTVTFTPSAANNRTGAITFVDSDLTGTQSVSVSGLGLAAPTVGLSPASVTYSSVGLGTSSTTTVQLTNNSTTTNLNISSITITGTNPGDFAQTNNCPVPVLPLGVCTLTITFTPGATGTRKGTLTIFDNEATGSHTLSLTGSGTYPSAIFNPSPLAFGTVGIGSSSTKTATLTNNTTIPAVLSISSITLTGSAPGDYVMTNDCPATLAQNAFCTFTVTFTPTANGSRNSTLNVNGNMSGGTKALSITGSGNLPTATLSPSSFSFGSQQLNTTSIPKTSTLTNTSTTGAILNISSIVVSGTNASEYAQSNNCPSSLVPNASCTVSVVFTPTATGSRTGTVTVYSNTSTGSNAITLNGTGATAKVTLSPSILGFGSQAVGGSSATQSVTFTNIGTTSQTISSISVAGTNPGDFFQTNTCGTSVSAGASCTLSIWFSPTASGSRSAYVAVTESTATQTVQLSGTGTAPSASLSPSSLSFGDQGVGYASVAKTVTLSNTGSAVLNISGISISGTNASNYAQTNSCGSTLAAGSSCNISVTFTPSAAGSRTATLTFTDNAGSGSQSVGLTGNGVVPSATLAPATLTFADQLVGSTSATRAVTLSNSSSVPLAISGIAVSGANASEYGQTNNCGASLAANSSCTISVSFTPAAAGSRAATLTVTDNAASGSQSVTLSGNGVNPDATVSPASVSFSDQLVGSASIAQVVSLSNNSNVSLTINSLAVSGTNAADFGQTNTCGSSLGAHGSCTISITFTPASAGARSASLVISDNAASGSQSIALSGNGVVPVASLSAASLTFADQQVGSASASQSVTLTNTSTVALSINSITRSGANADDFAQSNTCGSSVAASASCTINVTFTPSAQGARSASLVISDNASPNTQTVALSGNGASAGATATPSALSFGDQLVGSSSSAQIITLNNPGTLALAISGISVSGANAGDYAVTNNCGASLAAGANCSINVSFTPSATGARTAAVTITDNAASGSQSVSLTGNGALPSASVTPASLAFGDQGLGSSSGAQGITIINTSSSLALAISGIQVSGANAADYAETHSCGSSLSAGASCMINVVFTPTATGARNATIVINDNSAAGSHSVAVSGNGTASAAATVSPTALSFADQLVGSASVAQTITLSNGGNAALNITSIAVTGANPGDYVATNTCGASLAAGGNCQISVSFAPGTSGTKNANVTITDDAGVQTVTLTGKGCQPTATVTPSALNFADQLVGSSSAAQAITLTNTSVSLSLSLSGISISGANSGDFAQTNTCGTSLAAGASCTISVTFTPTATGTRTANVTVADNTAGGSQTVPLSGSGTATPTATVSPSSLSYADQLVGSASQGQIITITNTSTQASLAIGSISVNGANASDYTQSNNCGGAVAPGGSCAITVVFAPSSTGTRTASIVISDNTASGTEIVAVTGKGCLPQATVTPSSVVFADQAVGSASAAQSLALNNIGTVPLSISGATITGGNASDFSQTSSCGTSLAAGASCTIQVVFTPSASGARSATLTVIDNASAGNQTVALSGNGTGAPVIVITPAPAPFGNQLVGTSSAPQVFTATNTGTTDLIISSLWFSGSADFAQTNTCGSPVAPGASCSISVTLTPSSSGSKAASLNVTNNSAVAVVVLSLTGTGIAPNASLSPTSLAFGDQLVGSASTSRVAVLTNNGTAALTISGIAVSGVNAADYTQNNSCGTSLAAGASCSITVTFTPAATGSRSASVVVTDNAGSGSQSVALSGNGALPSANLSTSALTFADQLVGSTSGSQTVTLTNSSNVPLTVSSISMTGADAAQYVQTNTCGSSVAAGASCTITVSFAPTSTGTKSASVSISDNAASGTQTVTLSGQGAVPSASLSPASLTYPSQAVGTTSTVQTITLSNASTVPLSITSIAISGSNAGEFAQSNTCGNSVPANGSCVFSISFTPSGSGSRTATLSVTDNAASGTQTASLTGTGTYPTLTLTPTSLFYGTVGLGTSSSKTVTITNTGTVNLMVSSLSFMGANPGDFSQSNNCAAAIAPGATCVVTVIFTPSVNQQRTATLNINSNISAGVSMVSLTGTGGAPTATLSPTSAAFGNVTVGTTSAPITHTLTNTSTNGAILFVSGITLTGANTADFSQSNTCPASLAPNASCTITVTFTPKAIGSRTALLNALVSTPSGVKTSSLSGTGK